MSLIQLFAYPVSSTSIRLVWRCQVPGATVMLIEMKLTGGEFSQIDSAPVSAGSKSITDLEPNTTYFFRVRAYTLFGIGGISDYSNETSARTYAEHEAPGHLSGRALNGEAVLSWENRGAWQDNVEVWKQDILTIGDGSWSEATPPSTNHWFYEFCELKDGTIFGVGGFGIAKSSDNGLTWSVVKTGEFRSIGCFANDVLLAGRYDGYVFRSTDRGVNWTDVWHGDQQATIIITDAEAGEGLIINYSSQKPVMVEDFGATIYSLNQNWPRVGGYHAQIIGNYVFYSTESHLYRGDLNFSNWLEITPSGMSAGAVVNFQVYPDGVIVLKNRSAGVWRSTDWGDNWTQKISFSYQSMASFATRESVIIVGQTKSDGAHVLVSPDRGDTWEDRKTFGTDMNTGLEGMLILKNLRLIVSNNYSQYYVAKLHYTDADFSLYATLSGIEVSYTDSEVSPGNCYQYKVRAKWVAEGGYNYSDFTNVVMVCIPELPVIDSFEIDTIKAESASFTWSAINADYYRVLLFNPITSDWDERLYIDDPAVAAAELSGLETETSYQVKLAAGNGGGESLSSELEFETLPAEVRVILPHPEFEVKAYLTFWTPYLTLTPVDSGIYSAEISGLFTDVRRVTDSGSDLNRRSSLSELESSEEGYYFQRSTRTIYVKPEATDRVKALGVYDTAPTRIDLGDVSREFRPASDVSRPTSGGVRFTERRESLLSYEPDYLEVKVGGQPFIRSKVSSLAMSDDIYSVSTSGAVVDLNRDLPLEVFSKNAYPDISPDLEGKEIPVAYGLVNSVVPIEVSSLSLAFKLANHSIAEVHQVTDNGIPVAYSVDRLNGVVVLSATPSGDIVVDFVGKTFSNGSAITHPIDILIDIFSAVGLEGVLEVTSLYRAKSATPDLFAGIYIDTTETLSDLLDLIQRSMPAVFYETGEGKIAVKTSARYYHLAPELITSQRVTQPISEFVSALKLKYNHNHYSDVWDVYEVSFDRDGGIKEVESPAADYPTAQAVASFIASYLNRSRVELEIAAIETELLPGDRIISGSLTLRVESVSYNLDSLTMRVSGVVE